IQEKEIMAVGATHYNKIDVRLICATNADLEKMVSENKFREDLYYRLNVIEIRLPPLRERMGDLPLLVDHFLRKFEAANQKKIEVVEPSFMEILELYAWPGNIRELENLIERVVVLSRDGTIDKGLLPPNFIKKAQGENVFVPSLDFSMSLPQQVQALERALIQKALKAAEGVQKHAAELLGLKTTTLNEMLKRHKMR
ncbi:MAG: sigma-54-dependent Fis family transcriptional regulator, partial [Acidobacteria bacterium]|nr:sigma-54-dependent Fis family transcriptional regulator [Acidobacteriota bacterium]